MVARRHDLDSDAPWAEGYPLDGDARACAAYASRLPVERGGEASDPYGYYQILEDGMAVGGIGFHGPPSGRAIEVGYGVVASVRGRGVATTALQMVVEMVRGFDGVQRIVGRTEETNVGSQRVMLAVGMQKVGRDPDFLHFEIDLSSGT